MVESTADKKPDAAEVQKAKLAFLVGIADLSWRLAAIFMLPVLIGFGIDSYRDTKNAVVVGTGIGFILSVIFIINLGIKANKK